jgi:lipopolysaccharide export system protein LptA
MRTFTTFCLALVTSCFLFSQTRAQSAASDSPALSGTPTNGETKILSDNGGEFYYKLKTYIYRGNVRVDNPQMKLTCELLTIESPEFEEGKYNRATAETNVVIDWVDEHGTNHATAAKAVYLYLITNLAKLPEKLYQTNATVVLTGSPFVLFGRDTFKGDPIVWDRIRDVISTTNFQKTTIISNTNMFDTGVPRKTNSLPK